MVDSSSSSAAASPLPRPHSLVPSYRMYFPLHSHAEGAPLFDTPHGSPGTIRARRTARDILIEQLCKPNMTVLDRMYPLLCTQCGMSFIRQAHLDAHMRLHQSQTGIKCPECEDFCHDNLSLQEHLGAVHSPPRAFPVMYSIAERISYHPPETFKNPAMSAQRPVVSPPVEVIPDDFAYQSAFGASHKRRRLTSLTEPPLKRQKSPPAPHRPKMTILETLLLSTEATRPALPNSLPQVIVNPHMDMDAYSPKSMDTQDLYPKVTSPSLNGSASTSTCGSGYTSDSSGGPASESSLSDHPQKQVAKDVACEHCGKRFLYKCNLARHLSAIHHERTIKTESTTAGKSPRSPFKVGPAQSIPTEKKKVVLLKCKFCERSFTQKSSLVLHQQVHQGQEPYRCSICHGLRFSKAEQWQEHMERHRIRPKPPKFFEQPRSPATDTIVCVD